MSKAKYRIGRSANTWVAVAVAGSAVVGAGVGMYGANKQAKADAAALQANKEATEQQNRLEWGQYLMSRGINPGGANVEPGVIPTNAAPMNSRMPVWATVARPAATGFRLTGTRPRLAVSSGAQPSTNPPPSSGGRSFDDLRSNPTFLQ